jgi:hypothetical protein
MIDFRKHKPIVPSVGTAAGTDKGFHQLKVVEQGIFDSQPGFMVCLTEDYSPNRQGGYGQQDQRNGAVQGSDR